MSGSFSSNDRIFRGFSTVGLKSSRNTALNDIDLVKQDLAFAFGTRVGERVMRPDYGCKIWDYFMEPLTDYTREAIVAEATRICRADSRLEVVDVAVTEIESGLIVQIVLNYIPYAVVDTFTATFEQRQTDYIQGPFSS